MPWFAVNPALPRMFPFPKLSEKSGFYVILFFIRKCNAMQRMTISYNIFILSLVEIAAVSADQGKSLLRYAMTKIRLRITVSTLYMFINHHTSYPDQLLIC